jgi:type II secretory pathway component PulM
MLAADTGGNYVAAAYVVFLALVLIYVAIMATKLARIERELNELTELEARRSEREAVEAGRGWPAAGRSHQDAGLEAPRR